jgi:hypothetical protein
MVSRPGRPVASRARWRLGVVGLLSLSFGCAARQERMVMPPTSVQALQYYPFQVKGYQNLYPKRRTIVLPPTDARSFDGIAETDRKPDQGRPAIGVIVDATGKTEQRLYGPPLEALMQDAIAHAAQEAGLSSTEVALPLPDALAARAADYVISVKILRCWVRKERGGGRAAGPSWRSVADVALEVAIYKPPFTVPFWQGQSAAVYNDPPPAVTGDVTNEVEIYEQPGEVLAVALTRAVAGIFKRDDLYTLMTQDAVRVRRQ